MSPGPQAGGDWRVSSPPVARAESANNNRSKELQSRVAQIFQTLAKHGAGAASSDLALDLALHEFVEQAKDETNARSASISLMRDRDLICRASAGEDAPELGRVVDMTSGLAEECVSARELQVCDDAATSSGVNSDICRRLGVRSVAIAPLIDAQGVVGVLQVFSERVLAFGSGEAETLKRLSTAIVENVQAAKAGVESLARPATDFVSNREGLEPSEMWVPAATDVEPRRLNGIGNSVLLVVVLAVAVLLGLVLGWSAGWRARKIDVAGQPPVNVPGSAGTGDVPISSSPSSTIHDGALIGSEGKKSEPPANQSASASSRSVPVGGLIITENGKTIYPASADSRTHVAANESRTSASQLVRRVNPQYPSAAVAGRIQGAVLLNVRILRNGSVGDVVVLSGDPLLSEAAIKAVKQWQFVPSSSGDPGLAERETQITIRFTLPPE